MAIDVLYIHPSKYPDKPSYGFIPIGVFSIMSQLYRDGFNIEMLNYGLELSINDRFSLSDALKEVKPKYVLIDLHWYEHSFGAVSVAQIVKGYRKEITVICGGLTASIFPREVLEFCDCIDYVVCGEADFSVLELIRSLENGRDIDKAPNIAFRANGSICFSKAKASCIDLNELRFLDSLPYLRHFEEYLRMDIHCDFLKKEMKHFWVSMARGCVYDCVYCGGGKKVFREVYGKRNIAIRSITKVISDIRQLYDAYEVNRINTTHDPTMFGPAYLDAFLSGIQGIQIGCNIEFFQLPNVETIKKIYQCFVPEKSVFVFSPLVGDEGLRQFYGKKFSNQDLLSILAALKDIPIRQEVYFTNNFPNESLQQYEATLELASLIWTRYPDVKIYVQPIMLEPLSRMSDLREALDINLEVNSFSDYYDYCRIGNRYERASLQNNSLFVSKFLAFSLLRSHFGIEVTK